MRGATFAVFVSVIVKGQKILPFGKVENDMKHALVFKVAKTVPNAGIIAIRQKTIRERILKKFLGDPIKLTVLVPGDNVDEIEIRDIRKGGERNEQSAAFV